MKIYVSNTIHSDNVAFGSIDSEITINRTDFHMFKEFIETSGCRRE